jgi:Flp pilus assembly protein TadB
MTQNSTADEQFAERSTAPGGAARTAKTPLPDRQQQPDEAPARRSRLLAPLRWLRRKLSRLVRWVARHLPAPLIRLASLFDPRRERGFGFWWLVATVAVAVALGMVVALLLSPVAALIALLVVAIWALVRARRRKPDDPDSATSRPLPRGASEGPATAAAD